MFPLLLRSRECRWSGRRAEAGDVFVTRVSVTLFLCAGAVGADVGSKPSERSSDVFYIAFSLTLAPSERASGSKRALIKSAMQHPLCRRALCAHTACAIVRAARSSVSPN